VINSYSCTPKGGSQRVDQAAISVSGVAPPVLQRSGGAEPPVCGVLVVPPSPSPGWNGTARTEHQARSVVVDLGEWLGYFAPDPRHDPHRLAATRATAGLSPVSRWLAGGVGWTPGRAGVGRCAGLRPLRADPNPRSASALRPLSTAQTTRHIRRVVPRAIHQSGARIAMWHFANVRPCLRWSTSASLH